MDSKYNPSKNSHSTWCSAPNCHNSRAKNPDLAFFSFPTALDRCNRWVQNTRRTDLLKKDLRKVSRARSLCEEHFDSSQFMNPNDKGVKKPRKRLRWDAEPTIFNNGLEQINRLKTKSASKSNSCIILTDSTQNVTSENSGKSSSGISRRPYSRNLLLSTDCMTPSFNSLFFDIRHDKDLSSNTSALPKPIKQENSGTNVKVEHSEVVEVVSKNIRVFSSLDNKSTLLNSTSGICTPKTNVKQEFIEVEHSEVVEVVSKNIRVFAPLDDKSTLLNSTSRICTPETNWIYFDKIVPLECSQFSWLE